jgi:protein with PEP-CTERM/exosortase system signal
VDGSISSSSGVMVNAGTTLGGHGNVSNISGGGTIAPGSSPGILTATQLDPSGGASFLFELTQVGSPTYNNAAASGNDLLRLTSATPITSALTSANVITVDFSGASLVAGEIFRGGFFTDTASTTADVSSAMFNYIGLNGFTVNFDGFVIEPVADFSGGTVTNGSVLEFGIAGGQHGVPDQGSTVLLLTLALLALATCHRQSQERIRGILQGRCEK